MFASLSVCVHVSVCVSAVVVFWAITVMLTARMVMRLMMFRGGWPPGPSWKGKIQIGPRAVGDC